MSSLDPQADHGGLSVVCECVLRGCRRVLDTALSHGASGSYRMPAAQRRRYSERYGSAYQQLLEREGLG